MRERLKGDAAKVKLAERLRAETVQTVAWLAKRYCFNATTVPAACSWFWLHTRPEAGGK